MVYNHIFFTSASGNLTSVTIILSPNIASTDLESEPIIRHIYVSTYRAGSWGQ